MNNENKEFPKYLKTTNLNESTKDGFVFVREGLSVKGGEATYLRVCGDWRAYVKLREGKFIWDRYNKGCAELVPATATEFLNNSNKELILSDELEELVESPSHREYLRNFIREAEKEIELSSKCERVYPTKEKPSSYTEDDLIIK